MMWYGEERLWAQREKFERKYNDFEVGRGGRERGEMKGRERERER